LVALIGETYYIQLLQGLFTVFLSIIIKPYYQDVSNDSYEDLSQKQTNLLSRQIELSLDKDKTSIITN
jgi:hypothetical protein